MPLTLGMGLEFKDLYSTQGLKKIDQLFLNFLKEKDNTLWSELKESRNVGQAYIGQKPYSDLIVNIAPYLEQFIAKLFSLEKKIASLTEAALKFAEIAKCKRLFVQRQAIRKYQNYDLSRFKYKEKLSSLEELIGEFSEYNFATYVNNWLSNKEENQELLEVAAEFAAWASLSTEGKKVFPCSILFSFPKKRDHLNLVQHIKSKVNGVEVIEADKTKLHSRDNFSLTDKGTSLEKALDQAHYCIYCHNQEKDSCSKGLIDKTKQDYKENEFGEKLIGCPLGEKISEMNFLKTGGFTIGALAAATIDNPLIAATGHRICNDCMKACIYQKQDPVNIPQIESRVLSDVLSLDWGFEIYSLLTRWNPLHLSRPYPKDSTNKNILIAGLGPAGFNLSHHLLNDGHNIYAIDGLKIEPIDPKVSGIDSDGERTKFEPIKNINKLFDDLDTRTPQGFGGVAEYGITVRWNKNNLKIIRLLLERRENFRMYGGVRFGSQVDYSTIKDLGFDHLALAMGAGKPNLVDVKNVMVKGVRTASDFLMGLQLTGAAREQSFANMQIRLPILVVGGGLTAIDTATEAMAYYVRQVEKFAERHNILIKKHGQQKIEKNWSEEEKQIANEFLEHADLFAQERVSAIEENRQPNFISIIRKLGGVNIIYRKRLIDAPSYRLNPEEVGLALEEGIGFIEHVVPTEIFLDNHKHLQAVKVMIEGQEKVLSVRTLLLAIGTSPNVVAAKEDEENFVLDGKYFRAVDSLGNKISPDRLAKPKDNHPLIKIEQDYFAVSYFGDLHPSYSGNVVKAMASAKNGYGEISKLVEKRNVKQSNLFKVMNELLTARIQEVNILAPKIVELIIHAPLAAQKFQPGQFYRLQNFEKNALNCSYGKLAMEGVALTGASVDKEAGTISLIALEMGGSADLCRHLKKNEKVILMGPTGKPTEIKSQENVVLIGGGLGNAVLFSIGKAFRAAGSKVLYFAGYKKLDDLYKQNEIEDAADQVIWCCDGGLIKAGRKQDQSFHGNIVEAISSYAENKLPNNQFALDSLSRIIAIGSDSMMNAVHQARQSKLRKYFPKNYHAVASINSPMQCMMKEICAQCLQKHRDPQTGLETYVYSCFNQDQDMNKVDFPNLKDRLAQNALLEKQTALWLDLSLKELNLR